MPELLTAIAIFIIYVYPFKGLIPLNPKEEQIMKSYKFPEIIDIANDKLVKDDGTSDLIDSDYSTLSDLGSKVIEENVTSTTNKKGDTTYNKYTDIDINNL